MSHFVLVHGGAHGAWCWDYLIPHLRKASGVDSVLAIDLSGHGSRRDCKPTNSITLADYVNDVVGTIENNNLHDVLLVGHSLAGITIPLAAERIASRMRRLIYVATSNPVKGQSIVDLMQHPLNPIARGTNRRAMFCSDLDEDMATWMLEQAAQESEPPGPVMEPFPGLTGCATYPSTYILLEHDQALPPAYQREQAANAGVDEIIPFAAGHSAYLSRPKELAELLAGYA